MRLILALLSFLCAACATGKGPEITSHKGARYDVSSVLNDYETGKVEDQELMSVSGYLTFGDDKHNLWNSAEEYRYLREKRPPRNDPAWKKCISLAGYGKFRRSLFKYDGQNVMISGRISRRMLGSGLID